MKRKMVKIKDIIDDAENPFQRLLPPADDRLVRLLGDVAEGKAPSWRATVRLAELSVHDPETLPRVRAGLVEEPGLHAELVKETLTRTPGPWVVYRAEDGRLVMFDDYVWYVVTQEVGREWVNVQILGEAAPRP